MSFRPPHSPRRRLFVRCDGPTRAWLGIAAAAWFFIAFASAWNKSATMDEVPHFGSGMAVVDRADYRMNPEHPMLVKVLSVLPVYWFYRPLMDIGDESTGLYVRSWAETLEPEYGQHLLYRTPGDFRRRSGDNVYIRVALMRLVPMLIGLLGGVLAFAWAREFGRSRRAGFIAALLLLAYPEYLGHARFLTLDVPTLVGCAGMALVGFRWWQRPTLRRTLLFALAAGVASQIKIPVVVFTGLVLLTLTFLWPLSGSRVPLVRLALLWLLTAAAGYLAAWTAAGFRFEIVPPDAFVASPGPYVPPATPGTPINDFVNSCWQRRLLPEATLSSIMLIGTFDGRMQFLLGDWSRTGTYPYFLFTFLLKTPLLFIAAVVALPALLWRRWGGLRRSRTWAWRLQRAAIFWLPFLGLLAIMVRSRANLGHRYILFVYLPLCVGLGVLAARGWRRGGAAKAAAALLLAGQLASTLTSFPNYATYFHCLVGTPYAASDYLADSNIDWGQDLPQLGATMQRLGYDRINLAYFGVSAPESYGIANFRWLLPSYPFAINMPAAQPPDPSLPTASSLNTLGSLRIIYPELYNRQPDLLLNSIVVFLPEKP